tara:strand:+ start:4208 stop:4390 length:183 start_codon:yes stop_codon:yes gene_type:complete
MRKILGIKVRYFNSGQFKGIAQAVLLGIIAIFLAEYGINELAWAFIGATITRLMTLRRFY